MVACIGKTGCLFTFLTMFLVRRKKCNLLNYFIRNYARSNLIHVRNDALHNLLIEQPKEIKWNEIRKEIFQTQSSVNKTNIDAIIIGKCYNGARLDIAKSYFEYLNSNKIDVSDAFKIKLIRLYYSRYRTIKDHKEMSLTDEDRNDVLKLCKEIMIKFPEMDINTAENVIHGLSLTSEWREAERYFQMLSEKTANSSVYSAFISKAISEGDEKLAWKYLNFLSDNLISPKSFIFIEWFNKYAKDEKKIEDMFEYISQSGIFLQEMALDGIVDALRKTYHCTLVTINKKGICPSCDTHLSGVKLMESEFNKMAKKFLDDIIIKSDVFIKTNPKEIERFKNMINRTIPFDCVIDGLNVAYSQGNKGGPKVYSKVLAQVVKHFVDQKQKCLVIGRSHMDSWPKKEISFIKNNSTFFLLDD